MPAIVIAAFANDLNPAIDAQRRLMARWSCSMRLLKYWLVRTFTLRQHGCSRRSSHSALARTAVGSQQLTEQGPGRYNRSIGSPEAVGLDLRQFKYRLKRVPGLGRCLEVAQRI